MSLSTQAGVLNEDYYPGDVGFDPLGLKPTDPEAFAEMQTKELKNGRLALLAAAGFLAQELVNHKPILETLKLLILLDDSEISKNLGINLCGNQMTRRDASSMAWWCGSLAARLGQHGRAPDSLVDLRTGINLPTGDIPTLELELETPAKDTFF